MLAFSRSGRSLVTRVTDRPSLAIERATARIRWSFESVRNAAGSPLTSWWFSSTRSVPPSSFTGSGAVERPVLGAQQLERPEALAGGPAELRVVALALQLGDHGQREDNFVLGKAVERPVISEEHRGVEDVHLRLPGRSPGTRCNCRLDPRAGQ